MKLNTLLLTSAATLMATTVAFAADLPSKKAAPSSGSVQVCKVAGKTGFSLPGSDTCVVLSGYVYAQAQMHDTDNAAGSDINDTSDSWSSYASARLHVDTLSNTEMGVLSSRMTFDVGGGEGNFAGGDWGLRNAYVQLGGFTAGYKDSTFSANGWGPTLDNWPTNSYVRTNQLAYSGAIGNGATVGIALEDMRGSSSEGDYDLEHGMPDVVGTVDFKTMGADIHLGGVWHDTGYSDISGYAFNVGGSFALDSIAKGDKVNVEMTYTHAADQRTPWFLSGDNYTGGYGADSTSDDDLITTTAISADFTHVMSKSVSVTVFGGWGKVTNEDDSSENWTGSVLGVNLDFQPVKNFHIKPEFSMLTITDEGSDSDSEYLGTLRIQRDF